MIVELILPIEALRGALRQDGFYFRKYKGRQLLQRCPNRKGHVKTEAEARNQERFAEQYGRKNGERRNGRSATGLEPEQGKPAEGGGYKTTNKTKENGKDQEDGTGEAAGGASDAG
jgi:hypothetical protein